MCDIFLYSSQNGKFQAAVVEKIKIHVLCSVNFFPENRAVYDAKGENTGTHC
jgi:hypothetical protein